MNQTTSFMQYEGVAADIFRLIVVFLHATVEDLVRSQLPGNKKFSFQSGPDIDKALKRAGFDPSSLKPLYRPLTAMAKRRNRIVHEADLASHSSTVVEPWSVSDIWQILQWNLAVLAFYYQMLIVLTEPRPSSQPPTSWCCDDQLNPPPIRRHSNTERLAEAGIEPSVGSVGDSYDNALAERSTASTRPRSFIDEELAELRSPRVRDPDLGRLVQQSPGEQTRTRGRTVTLKVKFADFEQITRSLSVGKGIANQRDLQEIALDLLRGLAPMKKRVRLLGITLSSLCSPDEPSDQMSLEL